MEARITGFTFIGVPCPKCGTAERYLKREICVECTRRYHRAWHAKNRETHNAKKRINSARARALGLIVRPPEYEQWKRDYNKKYRAKHGNRLNAYCVEWRKRNKERFAAATKAWRKNNLDKCRQFGRNWKARNPEKNSASRRIRRAKLRAAGPPPKIADLLALMARQNNQCMGCYCDIALKPITENQRRAELDHIMPVALGGTNSIENLQYLCKNCNASKGATHPAKWLKNKGDSGDRAVQ